MRQLMRKNEFSITWNTAFDQVIEACQKSPRRTRMAPGSQTEMKEACISKLHELGFAKSIEVWKD